MTPEQFVYWLQGYFELTCEVGLTRDQTDTIKEHLSKVFNREYQNPLFQHINPYQVKSYDLKFDGFGLAGYNKNCLQDTKKFNLVNNTYEQPNPVYPAHGCEVDLPAKVIWNDKDNRWETEEGTHCHMFYNPFSIFYTGPPYSC